MYRLFVVSHTHWDREWYEPFQIFRLRLVHCIDQLLDIFATDPDFKFFLLDGQTIVLEDYLEVRPDREDKLRDLVSAGRLAIGPWYILPDTFLVSGEAIIRNLQRGIRIAKGFGKWMKVGYIPDPFGHISQLPQILRGFGMDTAVFRRGLADEPNELWWDAADGTRVLALYLRDGYDNAAFIPHDEVGFASSLQKERDSLAPFAATRNLLLLNGTDHMDPWQDLPRLLQAARERLNDTEILHASLPMYVSEIEKEIAERRPELPVVRGELRNSKRHHLLPGVASSRMWIKQQNAQAQTLLEKWVEPLSAFAQLAVSGSKFQVSSSLPQDGVGLEFATDDLHLETWNLKPETRLAWKYLLQNHPHDSICGCGSDVTDADMAARFRWVEQIAGQLIQAGMNRIAGAINTQGPLVSVPLVVFNTGQGPRTDFVTAWAELPEPASECKLVDESGREIPCHVTGKAQNGLSRVEFIAQEVPAFGYKTLFLLPNSKPKGVESGTLAHKALENEFFRVEANEDDATLTVTDKTTGAVFRGLNRFVDEGDRGDLYNYCPPERDSIIYRPSTPPRIELERTAVRQTLRMTIDYTLPAELLTNRSSRSEKTVREHIEAQISLYPGVHRIDFSVRAINLAKDHRLRVEFPTTISTDHASAEQAFDVVNRPLELPRDTSSWVEQPRPEAPMQSFVSVSDGRQGLTLSTHGLPEYEVRPGTNGVTVIITLLRCVEWLSRNDLATRRGDAGPQLETPGAQEIGEHTFEYALVPHAGDWRNAVRDAHEFVAPMRALVTLAHPGSLPQHMGLLTVSPGEFVVTAIKPAEEGPGLILRGYNIGLEPINALVKLWREFSQCTRVDLNEDYAAPLPRKDKREAEFRVRPKEIVTLRFDP